MLPRRPALIMFQTLLLICGVYSIDNNHNLLESPSSSIRTSDRRVISTVNNNNDNKSPPILISRHLTEGSMEVVFLNITNTEWTIDGGGGGGASAEETPANFYILRCVVTSRNPRVVRIINSSLIHHQNLVDSAAAAAADNRIFFDLPNEHDDDLGNNDFGSSLSVQIAGRSLGRTVIDVAVYGYEANGEATKATAATGNQSNQRKRFAVSNRNNQTGGIDHHGDQQQHEVRMITSFDVSVLRRSVYNKLSSAFTIFVAIISIVTTFLIGTQLEWKIIITELKKPFSLLVGIGCEFVLMPLVSFALALTLLRGNYGWQLACLAIGSCPGGGHSPFWTMMLDGNLDLAVAISFVASIAALGILPFWLFTLGRVFYGGRVTIPYVTITASLFGLVCPIFVGLAFKHFLPKLAERIGKILKLLTVISFVVVGIFGSTVNWYVFTLLDWRHILCGMLLPWAGYFLTYPLSRFVFRRTHQDSLAIGVENGCLNVAVPIVLLQLSLAQPDADLSLVVPVGIVMCSSWPLWIYFIILLIKRRFGKKASANKSAAAANDGETTTAANIKTGETDTADEERHDNSPKSQAGAV